MLNLAVEETRMEETLPQSTTPTDSAELEVAILWSRIQNHLENERRRIYQEIRDYPTPIAACDAQFNHLLEERASVCQELRCVREAIESDRRDANRLELLAELTRASRHLDEDLRRRIDSSLAARLSEQKE
jgi:hypothetical protein